MNPKARETDVLIHEVDGEVVVYDTARKKAHRLNEMVSKVWRRLDGTRSVTEIASELDVDESVVLLSVDELASAELLEVGQVLSVSRRTALLRVANAAAVGFLLPAVTSMVAPMAAHAASEPGSGVKTSAKAPSPTKKGSTKKKAAKKK